VEITFRPSLTDRRGIVAKEEHRTPLLDMMDNHAKRHSMIPNAAQNFLQPSVIHQESAQEVYLFCVQHNLPDAWAYLACEWYCAERWPRWARSSVSEVIPAASTTMMVEAHWSLIKRHHLITSPRARLDRVIYILMEETVPQLLHKWHQALLRRRYVLPFEQDFLASWNKFADVGNIDVEPYYVNVEKWLCSCPAYLSSRFLICKHLYHVRNGEFANYVHGKLSHSPCTSISSVCSLSKQMTQLGIGGWRHCAKTSTIVPHLHSLSLER
jgi:hypothetical protein